MNKRIQELMVELKKTVSTHRGDAVLIGYDEIEKFAELIVRECINQAHSVANLRGANDDMVYGADTAALQISKYFGVENEV